MVSRITKTDCNYFVNIESLIDHNLSALTDARLLLNVIDDARYQRHYDMGRPASIGMHVRHVIDHYQCFLDGMNGQKIDYDNRQRDERIERDTAFARRRIDQVCSDLKTLRADIKGQTNRKPAIVKVSCSTSTSCDPVDTMDSTLERELAYLHSHSIHHMALIRLALVDTNIPLENHFGIAPSTLKSAQDSAGV